MSRRLISAFTTLALVLTLASPTAVAVAASDVPGGADLRPPGRVLNDHTVYAVHFTETDLPASTTLNVNVRLSAWMCKYYFKRGLTRGLYRFKAAVPASSGLAASVSPVLSIRLR